MLRYFLRDVNFFLDAKNLSTWYINDSLSRIIVKYLNIAWSENILFI